MNEIVNSVTMTSLEMVDFINGHRKEQAQAAGTEFPSKGYSRLDHANFLKKVPEVLGACAVNFYATYEVPGPRGGFRSAACYRFPKREACLMAMSYSYELQAKVFDRMTALEQGRISTATITVPQSLPDALRLAADLAEQKLVAEQQRDHAQQQVAQAAPKVDALERIARSEGEFNIREAAKDLKVPERKFVDWLIRHEWAFRNGRRQRLVGYREKEKAGYIRHDVKTVKDSDGEEFAATQMLFTAKGIARIAIEMAIAVEGTHDPHSDDDPVAVPDWPGVPPVSTLVQ